MNAVQTPQIDIVGCLVNQNFYQRLGLKTNLVSHNELLAAYRARMILLENCQSELTESGMKQARNLLEEAIVTLRNSSKRAAYDQNLFKAQEQAAAVDCSTKKATETKPAPVSNSLLSDRYRVQHLVADGPRCRVYSAVDNRLNRKVIIKQIQPDLFAKKDHREMFFREAELFAGSNASNLVKILDFDKETGAVVVECMSRNLIDLQRDKPVAAETVREILRDALTGLATLHDQGISHGRLELSHLFIDDSGSVKLSVTPGITGVSTTLRPDSNTRHVAPELLNAKLFGPPGLPADLYVLGFITLDLLCGASFSKQINPAIESEGNATNGWLLWHASPADRLPPLRSLCPNLPNDLVDLLTRMTSKNQQERFADARECLNRLKFRPQESPVAGSNTTEIHCIAEEGIEMLGGLPPELHEQYVAQESITWSDIYNNPRLLTAPEARSKLSTVILAAATTTAIVLLLLLSGPTQPTDSASSALTQESSSQSACLEHLEEKELDTDEQNEIGGNSAEYESPNEDEPPNSEQTQAASQYEWPAEEIPDITSSILNSHGDQTQTTEESPNPNHFTFSPNHPPFEILGAETISKMREQYEVLLRTCEMTIQGYPQRGRIKPPYPLDKNKIVDPRASFALAIIAYKNNDFHESKDLCIKSLRDSKSLRAPFVIPCIFLSLLLDREAEYSTPLAQCRESINFHWQEWLTHSDPRHREASLILAWWMGVLVGYVEDVKGSAFGSKVDTAGAENLVRTLFEADPEIFQKFVIARLSIKEKFQELNTQRVNLDTYGDTRTGRQISHQNPLPLSVSYSRYDQRFANTPGSTIDFYTPESSGNMGQYRPFGSAVESSDGPRVRVNPRIATPNRLVSYYPLDLSALASQTKMTLRMNETRRSRPFTEMNEAKGNLILSSKRSESL